MTCTAPDTHFILFSTSDLDGSAVDSIASTQGTQFNSELGLLSFRRLPCVLIGSLWVLWFPPTPQTRVNMCANVCDMLPLKGVFPPHAQCSRNKLRIHSNPNQGKVLILHDAQ